MRVLVTGSTGFVGSHLCRALLAQGHTVRAFHRPASNLRLLEGLAVEHAVGDLTQPETIQAAMDGMEIVYHAAAWMGAQMHAGQSGKEYAVTVEGTRALLQAAMRARVSRVVHTSSVAALGVPTGSEPIDERHTWNYRPEYYPYGYAKYLAELEVQKAVAQGLNAVIVNPSLVFGPGDIYRQSSSIVAQIPRRRITMAPEGGINIIHVEDVITGHLAAAEHGRCGERYILANENMTFFQLMQCIAEIAGSPVPNLVLPSWLLRPAAGPAHSLQTFLDLPIAAKLLRMTGYFFYYDTSKARSVLGWEPQYSARQALEDAYRWLNPEITPQSHSSPD
jgi:dihydroflavonol-4-reductase